MPVQQPVREAQSDTIPESGSTRRDVPPRPKGDDKQGTHVDGPPPGALHFHPVPPSNPNPRGLSSMVDKSGSSPAVLHGTQPKVAVPVHHGSAVPSDAESPVLAHSKGRHESADLPQAQRIPQHPLRTSHTSNSTYEPSAAEENFVVRAATAALVRSLQAAHLLSSSGQSVAQQDGLRPLASPGVARADTTQTEELPPPPPTDESIRADRT